MEMIEFKTAVGAGLTNLLCGTPTNDSNHPGTYVWTDSYLTRYGEENAELILSEITICLDLCPEDAIAIDGMTTLAIYGLASHLGSISMRWFDSIRRSYEQMLDAMEMAIEEAMEDDEDEGVVDDRGRHYCCEECRNESLAKEAADAECIRLRKDDEVAV